MARSDLLLALVKAGSAGDKTGVRTITEAIIAEERTKQHTVLAERLQRALLVNGTAHSLAQQSQSNSARDFVVEMIPRRRLEDLFLSPESVSVIREFVEEQLRADVLRAHGVDPRHRILLQGPPGNGKTSLAEAIAESLNIPLYVIRYDAIIGSYLGETASRLRRVFDYIRTIPCLIFFDEFDAIGKERGDLHETGEIKRVVTSLLMQIDQLPSYTVIVGATNHPELLDRAAWRRFQICLELPTPTEQLLKKYFEQFLSTMGQKKDYASKITKAVGRISFSAAEQLCLNLRRKQILHADTLTFEGILAVELKRVPSTTKVVGKNKGQRR
jgi:SpoVK/Ycf46/Vps4 family AAA+-type ATPase